MNEENEMQWISGFWRRIGALLIDLVLLGFLGSMLGLIFEASFVQMGGWGRTVGFAIALAYFGVMNSRISGGQTVGKRILDLKVVDADNLPISVGKSVLRASILAIPFSLNGAQFADEVMLSYLVYPLSLVVFGGILSIAYLYLFNRTTRQSLHDLVAGTYVVNAAADKQEVGEVWRPHLIVAAVLSVVSLLAPMLTNQLAQSTAFKDILKAQSALSSIEGVARAAITTNLTIWDTTDDGSKTTSYVNARVFLTGTTIDDVEMARHFAELVIANYPQAQDKDSLQITLSYGYDIGIWSVWYNYTHAFDPHTIN